MAYSVSCFRRWTWQSFGCVIWRQRGFETRHGACMFNVRPKQECETWSAGSLRDDRGKFFSARWDNWRLPSEWQWNVTAVSWQTFSLLALACWFLRYKIAYTSPNLHMRCTKLKCSHCEHFDKERLCEAISTFFSSSGLLVSCCGFVHSVRGQVVQG